MFAGGHGEPVRKQSTHRCTRRHAVYADMARCVWGRPVTGSGPYAVVPGHGPTPALRSLNVVTLWLTPSEARKNKGDGTVFHLMLHV